MQGTCGSTSKKVEFVIHSSLPPAYSANYHELEHTQYLSFTERSHTFQLYPGVTIARACWHQRLVSVYTMSSVSFFLSYTYTRVFPATNCAVDDRSHIYRCPEADMMPHKFHVENKSLGNRDSLEDWRSKS